MRVQPRYIFKQNQDINFSSLFDDRELKCNNYDDFYKKASSKLRLLVMGKDLALPMKLVGVSQDFNTYFDVFGAGKFRLLLMPNKNGINNFSRYYVQSKETTLQSINRITELVKLTHPKEDLYIFESGAGEGDEMANIKGIIPAHLHFIANPKDSTIDINKIDNYFSASVGEKTTKFKDVPMDFLYDRISELSQDGILKYKFIAKNIKSDRFGVSLYVYQKTPTQLKSKSQIISKVLSDLFYNDKSSSRYNWKNIDDNPKNWNEIMKEKIISDRIENGRFLEQMKKLKILV
ncbi:MAG: hypothetical protein WCY19_01280 [Candidatus Gastranaerophilaceae bacterium]